jgi:ubiquinone/menaquinone biosynthesis C-methylase UbiE
MIDFALESEAVHRLSRLDAVFDLSSLESDRGTKDTIRRYYERSAPAYKAVHSSDGAIHMALNPSGTFDKAGYLGQAQYVAEWIGSAVTSVLELGAGRGFNLAYLAKRYPAVTFTGVDLVPSHVAAAGHRIHDQGLTNAGVEVGDFQSLQLPNDTCDLIFVIESLCHATDMTQALSEARRVLRKEGRFVVIDAWRTESFSSLPTSIQRASALTERAMSVHQGRVLTDWIAETRNASFEIVEDLDLTEAIMPNLRRFERLAERFLSHPRLARASLHVMSTELLSNAIAAYLMPLTVSCGAHTYRAITLS